MRQTILAGMRELRGSAGCLVSAFVVIFAGLAGFVSLDSLTRTPPAPDRIPLGLIISAIVAGGLVMFVAGFGAIDAVRKEGRRLDRRLRRPWAIAASRAGVLYILDMGTNEVIEAREDDFKPRSFTMSVFWGTVEWARDLVLDPDDALLVPDAFGGRLVRFTPSSVGVLYSDGVFHPTSEDPPEVPPIDLGAPTGVDVRQDGEIVVADIAGKRILSLAVPTEPHVLASLGEAGLGVVSPRVVRATGKDHVLVADRAGNRVLDVGLESINVLAGSGIPGYGGDGGMAVMAQLQRPEGLAVGPDGKVYVADTGNHVIRCIDLHRRISTIAGTGVDGFAGDGGMATTALLAGPRGVCIASWGGLLIADTENARIRWLSPDGRIQTVVGADSVPWPTNRSN